MTRLRNIVVAAALALSCGAHAQTIGGNASLSVSSVSARVALPAAGQTYRSALIAPASAAGPEVFYQLGNSSVVATTSNAALPSGGICVDVGPNTNLAAITASGTATLRITQATGCPEFVSAANAANASVSATGSAVPGSATYVGVLSGGNLVGWNGAVSESGTWTVQPGNTANTTPWLSTISQGGNSATVSAGGALKVDASASTQPISGAVTANQGGTWNINNIAGAISLPTGAATAANQTAVQGINGSAVPLAGVLVQGSDGTDARNLKTAADGTLKVDGSAVTQPVSAASLPLPSGAATAANQPAFGPAGTASADVITIQGIASMTAVKVDGSGVTQPISGTITANAGTNLNTSLLALEGGGNLATTATNTGTVAGAVSAAVMQSNVKQVNGATTLAGAGAVGTGAQRVAVGQDATTIAGSAPGTAGTASANVLTVQGIASMTPFLVNPGTASLWNTSWAGGTLGAMANYGTSPGAVLVPGVNAFITNAPTVVLTAETTKVIGTVNQGTSPWVSNSTLQAGTAIAGKFGIDQTTDVTTNGVEIAPTAGAAAGITPIVSASAESNHVFKSGAGNLYSAYVTTGASGGYLMIFNATSAPGDGAVTPIHCVQAPANQTVSVSFNPGPVEAYSTGITAVFSATGCFTKTASATAFFHGSVK